MNKLPDMKQSRIEGKDSKRRKSCQISQLELQFWTRQTQLKRKISKEAVEKSQKINGKYLRAE